MVAAGWPRGRRLSLSSLANDGRKGRAGTNRAHRRSLGPHEYRCSSCDSRNLSGAPKCSGVLSVLTSPRRVRPDGRSEEHTSELQSHSDLVCRLLLEKKKNHRCSAL